jgi:hypothetical protein
MNEQKITTKTLPIISCGVFRYEVEKVLPEVERELGVKLRTTFMEPALDVSNSKLEKAVEGTWESDGKQRTALLYGSACHGNMAEWSQKFGGIYPKPRNCVEIFLSPEKKSELDAEGNYYYLTAGSLRLWKQIFREAHGWDEADMRMNFGTCDKIIVLDTGVIQFTDEEIFEFFDYAQVPVEFLKVDLTYFKSVLLDICRRFLSLENSGRVGFAA